MAHKVLVAEAVQVALVEACSYTDSILCEPSATLALLDGFDEFVDAVADLPGLYPLCQEERLAAKGVRKALICGYVALYTRSEEEVDVIAFFHQTQDYARLLQG